MKCLCGGDTSVSDSRTVPNNPHSTRRRRECLACGKRFTTYEVMDSMATITVRLRSGRIVIEHSKKDEK